MLLAHRPSTMSSPSRPPERGVVFRDTPTALFRSLVQAAITRQGVPATEMGEFYLVSLLEALLRPAEPIGHQPLGLAYLAALQAPASRRYEPLRRVADEALAICGVFPESLERSLVGPEYYSALGRCAYEHLSKLSVPFEVPGGLTDVFAELADGFPAFAAVLADIAFETLFRRDADIMRLYRQWYYTRSPMYAARLIARGLIPASPPTQTPH